MTSQEFKNIILLKRPRYAESRIPVIEAFANKGKSKSEYSQFGPIYELYIYAFVLGLKKDLFLPLPSTRSLTKEFVEIGKWKRDSSLVDFLLMIIFTKTEELGIHWNELEDFEENDLNNAANKIVDFIEGYANGGLEFLQEEWRQNKLINSPYLFVDLLAESSEFKFHDERESNLEVKEVTEDLLFSTKSIISSGESSSAEFKSTLRVNLHTEKPDVVIELQAMKTIAGFMNTKKGTLLIGVSDSKEILGLDIDFNSFNKEDKMDEFQKHLDNTIEKFLGNSAFSGLEIAFPEIDGKTICRIDADFSSNGPIYVKNKSKNSEEFYIRRSASTKALNPSEMIDYIKNYWN